MFFNIHKNGCMRDTEARIRKGLRGKAQCEKYGQLFDGRSVCNNFFWGEGGGKL